MADSNQAQWLAENEDEAWRSLWALMTWLPVRLDAQLEEDAGLSLAEYHALSQISEAPDRQIRLSELANNTNMTLSHLSRVISRMEKAGWVERKPDPTDRRATIGSLTEEGWNKVTDSAPAHVATVRSVIFDLLDDEQIAALRETSLIIANAVAPARKPPQND